MKKITLTLLFFASLSIANAQFEKGSKWVAGSGNIGIGTSNQDNGNGNDSKGSNYSIGFYPSINNFKSDNKMNVTFLGYQYSGNNSSNSNNDNKSNSHSFRLGFGQRTIKPLYGKIYSSIGYNIFGDYRTTKSTSAYISTINPSTQTTISNNYSANINFSLGLVYRVNEKFAVTTTINNFLYGSLSSSNSKNEFSNPSIQGTSQSNLNLNGGFGLEGFNFGNLQFGLMYKLK